MTPVQLSEIAQLKKQVNLKQNKISVWRVIPETRRAH